MASKTFAVSVLRWRSVYSLFIVETFGNVRENVGGRFAPPLFRFVTWKELDGFHLPKRSPYFRAKLCTVAILPYEYIETLRHPLR